MKTGIVFLLLTSIVALELKAQQQNNTNLPDEQTIVSKKFDDKGNLIGYDSTSIFSWKMDTTFNFGVPADSLSHLWNFSGIEQLMNEFWSDSIFGNSRVPRQPFTFGFRFSPFGDQPDDPRQHMFSDSLFAHEFPFQFDSLFFNFDFNTEEEFHHQFNKKFMDDVEERMNRFFFHDETTVFPNFENEEQRKEWEQLMEKHRREMESLRKKWQE
jgi:hypothetical protein